jgi:hypothetical protein
LTSDIRNSIFEDAEWSMIVETANVEDAVVLDWPNVSDVPLQYGVELLVLDADGLVMETKNMRTEAAYSFVPVIATATEDDGGLLGSSDNAVEASPALLPLSIREDAGQVQRFVVHVYEIALSAELATFDAVSREEDVELNWTTSSEDMDHSGFNVYRATGNATDAAEFALISSELVISQNSSYAFADANVEDDEVYTYMLTAVDTYGNEVEAGRLNVTFSPVKSLVFALKANYPNPFNPSTTIAYNVPTTGHVSLKIYNAAGQLVKTLVDAKVDAGAHQIVWNGRNDRNIATASGVYFYVLEADNQSATRRMILLK